MIEQVSALLPYSCRQVFDLAADIEKYPEFLQGWSSARITRRDGSRCEVEQGLGLGPVQLHFRSTAVLDPPRRIDVTSTDRLFRKYALSWLLSESPPAGCRIAITAAIEFESRLLQGVADRLMPAAIAETLAAFARRARALYEPGV